MIHGSWFFGYTFGLNLELGYNNEKLFTPFHDILQSYPKKTRKHVRRSLFECLLLNARSQSSDGDPIKSSVVLGHKCYTLSTFGAERRKKNDVHFFLSRFEASYSINNACFVFYVRGGCVGEPGRTPVLVHCALGCRCCPLTTEREKKKKKNPNGPIHPFK